MYAFLHMTIGEIWYALIWWYQGITVNFFFSYVMVFFFLLGNIEWHTEMLAGEMLQFCYWLHNHQEGLMVRYINRTTGKELI